MLVVTQTGLVVEGARYCVMSAVIVMSPMELVSIIETDIRRSPSLTLTDHGPVSV